MKKTSGTLILFDDVIKTIQSLCFRRALHTIIKGLATVGLLKVVKIKS